MLPAVEYLTGYFYYYAREKLPHACSPSQSSESACLGVHLLSPANLEFLSVGGLSRTLSHFPFPPPLQSLPSRIYCHLWRITGHHRYPRVVMDLMMVLDDDDDDYNDDDDSRHRS